MQPIHSSGQALRQPLPSHDAIAASRAPSPNVSPSGRLLLSDVEGALLYGVSLRTFLALQHEAWFPKPVMLGPRLKRHIRGELEAAVELMPRPDRPAEPAQLLRGKIERLKRRGVEAT